MRATIVSFFRCEVLVLSLLALLVLCIYSNTFEAPFVLDDNMNILNNHPIRMTTLTIEEVRKAVFKSYNAQRPLAIMSFALNYYFNGYNVTGYHIVNILIHIIAGIFLYLFVKTTLRLPSLHFKDTTPEWIASFTVLIWLVHPLHTQSVTYIVQRMNSLAAMFYILSMLLYAKARMSYDTRQRWMMFEVCAFDVILAFVSNAMSLTISLFLI